MFVKKVLLSLGVLLAFKSLIVSTSGSDNATEGSLLIDSNLTRPDLSDVNANLLIEKLIQMESRIVELERKVQQHEMHIRSLHSDIQFFNPTVEHGYIDMNVVKWEEAVENGLHEDVSVTFNAGQSIGAFSTWTFYLSLENNETLGVDLALQQESYNKGVLYVGFSVFVLDSDDNVAFTKHMQPRDILATSRKILHLSDVISLSKISNPDFRLLKNGSFKLRFRIDLLGSGHKLHDSTHASNFPAKDTQTVLFEVGNLTHKLNTTNSSSNDTLHSIAFTRFQLKHPWGKDTNWEVILKSDRNTNVLTLFVGLGEGNDTDQHVFAALKLKLMHKNSKSLILNRETPLHDYNGKGIFLELMSTEELIDLMNDAEEDSVEFKLYVSVFGSNARYYIHV